MLQAETLLARKMGAFIDLSKNELEFLDGIQAAPIRVKRGKELFHEGEVGQFIYILLDGWTCSYKLLPDGGRQIITFPIPGDCVGMRSMLLRTSDHSFSALTDAVVTRVDAARVKQMFRDFPYLGTALLWATSRDEAMIVEHMVSIGRRSALERTAHFFLELFDRLALVGLTDANGFECPLNQYVLSDALGLSTIHVNRVLRHLRDRKLMSFRAHKVDLHDIAALKRLAGYETAREDTKLVR